MFFLPLSPHLAFTSSLCFCLSPAALASSSLSPISSPAHHLHFAFITVICHKCLMSLSSGKWDDHMIWLNFQHSANTIQQLKLDIFKMLVIFLSAPLVKPLLTLFFFFFGISTLFVPTHLHPFPHCSIFPSFVPFLCSPLFLTTHLHDPLSPLACTVVWQDVSATHPLLKNEDKLSLIICSLRRMSISEENGTERDDSGNGMCVFSL